MDTLVRLTLTLALIGNLTLPQTVTQYAPCCYDNHRNLTFACRAATTEFATHSTALEKSHSCCDPIKFTLRGIPAPQLNKVTAPTVNGTGWQAVMVAAFDFSPNFGRDIHALSTTTTGPPAFTNVLARHCRLNL